LYATRSLEHGYDGYSFKQLPILDKGTGKVLTEYFSEDIKIAETNWEKWPEDPYYTRPTSVDISTIDGTKIHVDAEIVNVFDARAGHPLLGPIGFVDFMAYQSYYATIQYKGGTVESGSSFFEYLVTVPQSK
jgi:hypothetical protein